MRYKIVSFMASDLQVVPITAAVAFLILVVMIIGLCTCLKGSDDNRNKKVKRRNKKEQEAGRKQTHSSCDAEKGTPNGAISAVNGERPKSHDRALPEIPDEILGQNPYELMPGEAQYDAIDKESNEQPEEGHIKVSDRSRAHSRLSSGLAQNLYELMPEDVDSDSTPTCSAEGSQTYAKPNKKREGAETMSDATGTSNEPQAEDAGDVLYAEPKKTKNPYEKVKDVRQSSGHGSTVVTNPQLLGHDSLSIDTLDASTSSAPPIPMKNFDPECEELDQSVASSEVARQISIPGVSPTLSRMEVDTAVVPLVSTTDVELMHIAPSQGFESGQTSREGKREPPYSKVTARESLENLRRRQVAMGFQTPTLVIGSSSNRQDSTDVDYDQINYDQIKTPATAVEPSSGSTGDSELYAEIGGSVPSSARNSAYAAVNDTSLTTHAPTPPPVDTLKHLTETGSAESGISQHGRVISVHLNQNSVASGSAVEGMKTIVGDVPHYAAVDKTKKTNNRHTFSGADGDSVEILYSKVNKNGLGSHSRDKSEVTKDLATGGAAIGYPVVGGGVVLMSKMPENDYCVVDDEKELNQEGSEIGSEYDPNYECVRNVSQPTVTVSRESGVAVETGVAREIETSAQDDTSLVQVDYEKKSSASGWNKKPLIREHIYQEINDAKKNSKRKSKEAKEQKRSSKHSHRDSGNGGNTKPL